jgi:hypothetical protein
MQSYAYVPTMPTLVLIGQVFIYKSRGAPLRLGKFIAMHSV